MKRIVSLFLCLMLLCPALALADGKTVTLEEMGIEYQVDLAPMTEYGSANVAQDGILSHTPYIAGLEYSYALIPPAEMERLSRAGSLTEEEQLRLSTLIVPYAFFFVSDGTAAQVADLVNQLADLGLKETEAVEFGTVEGFHYYYFGLRSRLIDDALEDYGVYSGEAFTDEQVSQWKAEADSITDTILEGLKGFRRMKPHDPSGELIGQIIRFGSEDLDGKPVSSETLFAANQITMVNFWGTWCPNCINEMTELGQLHQRLREKGCGIVGIESEQIGWSDELRATARSILDEHDASYPNVIMPADNELLKQAASNGYPTTLFVDQEGRILTYPIVGAAVSQYEPTLDRLLNGETVAPAPASGAAANTAGAYRVYVFDDAGPVKDVVVQFCSDTTCSFAQTDENGLASFTQPEGSYTIHVLTVPDGYEPVSQEYKPLDTYSDVNIFLKKIK